MAFGIGIVLDAMSIYDQGDNPSFPVAGLCAGVDLPSLVWTPAADLEQPFHGVDKQLFAGLAAEFSGLIPQDLLGGRVEGGDAATAVQCQKPDTYH